MSSGQLVMEFLPHFISNLCVHVCTYLFLSTFAAFFLLKLEVVLDCSLYMKTLCEMSVMLTL